MRLSLPVVGVLVLAAFLLGVGLTVAVFQLSSPDPQRPPLTAGEPQEPRAANEHPAAAGSPTGDEPKLAKDQGNVAEREAEDGAAASDTPAPLAAKDKPTGNPAGEAAEEAGPAPEKAPAPAVPGVVGSELGEYTELTATISGTVIDAQGNPVPGAEVISDVVERAGNTTRAGSAGKFATTDAGGTFTGTVKTKVGSKAAVTLALRARARGHAESRHVQVKAKSGDEKTGVRISMRPSGSVRGRVVNMLETGVPGARVSLESRDPEEGLIRDDSGNTVSFGGNSSATTDANGDYLIEDVPEGAYNLQLSVPGYKERTGPRSIDVQVGEVAQAENFVVAATTSLRARLIKDDGKPVLGWASFEVSTAEGEVVKRLSAMLASDGSVVVNNPPVGAFNVTVKVSGFEPAAKSWQTFIQDQQTDMGTLTLTPAAKSQESKSVMSR